MRYFRRVMLSGINISMLPDTQKIYYTATAKVEPLKDSLESRILTNEYNTTTGEGIIVTAEDITTIGAKAFQGNTALTSIKFPSTVKRVGGSAFADTVNLQKLWLSNGNAEFKSDAFKNTGITKVYAINIPVEYNGDGLDMVATNKCENCDASPFYAKKAELHDNIGIKTAGTIYHDIESYSLAGISGVDGIVFTIPYNDPIRTMHIGDGAFYSSPSSIDFTTTSNNEGIIIGESSFESSNIRRFTDMEDVIEFNEGSFYRCQNLISTSTPIKISTESIPSYCFGRSNLHEVIIDNVKEIKYAFTNSSIDILEINGNEISADNAFEGCTIGKLKLNATFSRVNATSAGVAKSVINELYINPNITHIQNYIFNQCDFKMDVLELPNTITSIGEYVFYAIKANKVIIPDTVTTISNRAFGYSTISYIKIGKGVIELKNEVFYDSKIGVYDFTNHEIVPILASNVFRTFYSTSKIIVPDSLYDEWIAATNWSRYADYTIKKSDWDAQQTTE